MFDQSVARARSVPSRATDHAQPARSRLRIGGANDAAEDTAERAAGSARSAAPARTAPGPTDAPGSVHAALRSPGHPLDTTARAYFEPRVGRELSDVRVHTVSRHRSDRPEYRIREKLYDIIDHDGGPDGAKARATSVEFIAKNATDFGPDLRAFIAKVVPEGYVPM